MAERRMPPSEEFPVPQLVAQPQVARRQLHAESFTANRRRLASADAPLTRALWPYRALSGAGCETGLTMPFALNVVRNEPFIYS